MITGCFSTEDNSPNHIIVTTLGQITNFLPLIAKYN
jgi:hypothetical protein